jgi:hypothetical protein
MFNAEEYFALVEDRLRSTKDAEIDSSGPTVTPSWDKWEVIVWRATIEWIKRDEVLQIVDAWSRRRRALVMHDFSYHFMRANGECIFRIDSHGEEIPYEGACHVHVGPNEDPIKDGDSRLHGHPLCAITFEEAFKLVHKHLKGRKMPWD